MHEDRRHPVEEERPLVAAAQQVRAVVVVPEPQVEVRQAVGGLGGFPQAGAEAGADDVDGVPVRFGRLRRESGVAAPPALRDFFAAADHVQIDHGDRVAQRRERLLRVRPGAEQAPLLRVPRREQDRPGGARPAAAGRGVRFGDLQQAGHAGGVVVRAVEDPAPGRSFVVEVGANDQPFAAPARIGPFDQTDDVVDRHRVAPHRRRHLHRDAGDLHRRGAAGLFGALRQLLQRPAGPAHQTLGHLDRYPDGRNAQRADPGRKLVAGHARRLGRPCPGGQIGDRPPAGMVVHVVDDRDRRSAAALRLERLADGPAALGRHDSGEPALRIEFPRLVVEHEDDLAGDVRAAVVVVIEVGRRDPEAGEHHRAGGASAPAERRREEVARHLGRLDVAAVQRPPRVPVAQCGHDQLDRAPEAPAGGRPAQPGALEPVLDVLRGQTVPARGGQPSPHGVRSEQRHLALQVGRRDRLAAGRRRLARGGAQDEQSGADDQSGGGGANGHRRGHYRRSGGACPSRPGAGEDRRGVDVQGRGLDPAAAARVTGTGRRPVRPGGRAPSTRSAAPTRPRGTPQCTAASWRSPSRSRTAARTARRTPRSGRSTTSSAR